MPIPTLELVATVPAACFIEETRDSTSVRISLRIVAPEGVAGRYAIYLDKSDSAGNSVNRQAGAFRITGGGVFSSGQIWLSALPDAQLNLSASIQVDGYAIKCGNVTSR